MHATIADKRTELTALCRRHGVARLDVFGSAARGALAAFADFKDALENLLGRRVDLVEREAVEASRNVIRRRRILAEAEPVYG